MKETSFEDVIARQKEKKDKEDKERSRQNKQKREAYKNKIKRNKKGASPSPGMAFCYGLLFLHVGNKYCLLLNREYQININDVTKHW